MNDGAWQTWIGATLKRGMTAIDIGANVGNYTRVLVDVVGPAGTVIAIEPDARHVPALTALGAHVLCVALADRDGEAVLYVDEDDPAQHTLYAEATRPAPARTSQRTVPVRAINRLVQDHLVPSVVDFVKIDTQGAEVAILKEADTWLRRPTTCWMLEVWPAGLAAAGASLGDLQARLEPSGYLPFDLASDSVTILPSWWTNLHEQAARCGPRQGLNVGFAVPGYGWI